MASHRIASSTASSTAPAGRALDRRAGRPAGRSSGRRADARENAEKVLRAAMSCLGERPDASINQIAHAAGVGRVTLYAHFASREALIDAALEQAMVDGDAVLDEVDLGDPIEGLRALIASSWLLTAQASGLLEAARGVLTEQRIREIHRDPEHRVLDLITRGQTAGAFRADHSAVWLASVLHHLMKGAAADVSAGRIATEEAPRLIAETVLAAYQPPTSEAVKVDRLLPDSHTPRG